MLKTEMPGSGLIKSRNSRNHSGEDQRLNVAIVILAKNEERNIGRFLDSLAAQTLLDRDDIKLSLYVVANGCTDRTAQVAREKTSDALHLRGIESEVLEWVVPGKSRSWNRVIHEVLPSGIDYILAMDADIEFTNDLVLAAMLECILLGDPKVHVVSGLPIKDSVRKARPNLVDRFSVSISGLTRYSEVINGSLYLASASCLAEIWLPDETPGEDGFLNAMVRTRGFSLPVQADVISQMSDPTHYFESHSVVAFFAHEKRMIVGTMINIWIFEYLQNLRLSMPAGPHIQMLNREKPDWVHKIIAERGSKIWLIPHSLLFRRIMPKRGVTLSYLLTLPLLLASAMLTLPPAIMANRALKKRGAASLW